MKKKLPAFGNKLLELRRTGDHPLCVHLIYGLRWRAPCECAWSSIDGAHPLLALKPLDYRPGVYDWRIVTGIYVALFDQGHERDDDVDVGPPRPWWCYPFYSLLGELAAHAADVEVYREGRREPAGMIVESAKLYARSNERPHWWPADLIENNAERYGIWLSAVAERRGIVAQCA